MTRILFLILYVMSMEAKYLRNSCSLCNNYSITIKNEHWFQWFEKKCYIPIRRSRECFHYDVLLDIHSKHFWKEWVNCNCIQDTDDYLPFLEEDTRQYYKMEL